MREIKFRAWNKVFKKMMALKCLYFVQNDAGVVTGHEMDGDWTVVSLNHLELLQYTGIKDINGREIYEGDILEVTSFEGSKNIARVCFEDGCFSYIGYLGDLRTYPLRDFLFQGYKLKVIGNTFEHPDLFGEYLWEEYNG